MNSESTPESRSAERDEVEAANEGATWLDPDFEVGFVRDTDVGADPAYWQQTYPCLIATMAAHDLSNDPDSDNDAPAAEEWAALCLAETVEDSDDDLEDSQVLAIYLNKYVA